MFSEHVVFLDLETTGGSALTDRIIEVGLVEVEHGRCVGEWSTLINPGRAIPFGIQNLTGITDAMVAEAPSFGEIAAALAERLEGKVLAAHNARFDYGFLKAELLRSGIRYTAPVLCTVKLSRRLVPHHARHNLDALLMRHAIFCVDRHRALGDARALWQLAQIWRTEHGEAALNAYCTALLKRPSVPTGLPVDVFDTLPEARGVYIFYGADDRVLYVGSSTNVRSRVMAHFSDGATQQDASIAAEVTRIDWLETAGAFSTCLHESRLRRTLSPAYNRKPADPGEHCTWHWRPETPQTPPALVALEDIDSVGSDTIYGLFRSRASARQALRGLCRTHQLCQVLMGLATAAPGRACDAFAAQACRGACAGAESPIAHAVRAGRALAALRIRRWPYAGPIGIRERGHRDDRSELHLVDRWRYLGAAKSEADLHELAQNVRGAPFDPDTYRMLMRFLGSPGASCDILPLTRIKPTAEELT